MGNTRLFTEGTRSWADDFFTTERIGDYNICLALFRVFESKFINSVFVFFCLTIFFKCFGPIYYTLFGFSIFLIRYFPFGYIFRPFAVYSILCLRGGNSHRSFIVVAKTFFTTVLMAITNVRSFFGILNKFRQWFYCLQTLQGFILLSPLII